MLAGLFMLPGGAKLREFDPSGDGNFLRSSMIQSFVKSAWAGPIPVGLQHSIYSAVIDEILEWDTTKVATVCTTEDEEFIVGYIIYDVQKADRPVVHYVYVKEAFRTKGVGRALLFSVTGGKPFYYTFCTKACNNIVKKLKRGFALHRVKYAWREWKKRETKLSQSLSELKH